MKVSREGGDGPLKSEILDDIIFPADEVVTMTFDNVDLNFATDESFTDSAISSKDHYKIENNGSAEEAAHKILSIVLDSRHKLNLK